VTSHESDQAARRELERLATQYGLDVFGGSIRRTSSRFCLGVEHGDYNGTELFGVGTDRFLWIAYKGNDSGRVRIASGNFPEDGRIEFTPGRVPEPRSPQIANSWARFPFGVDCTLRRVGIPTQRGFDAVVHGNIPGGGMSRSASLALNLILTVGEVNGVSLTNGLQVVDLAQAVENDYIGSPCGLLDQTMIYFARAGMGTHYRPKDRSIEYVPLGTSAPDFRLVSLDTGTVRPGLEKSTYKIRRAECQRAVEWIAEREPITALAELTDPARYQRLVLELRAAHPDLADRVTYIHEAQARFPRLLDAWRRGDLATVGTVLRADGFGLRDLYRISGPELETMCDIARTVPGVLGERMLGGGDKGAAGALVMANAVEPLRTAVANEYPRQHPDFAQRWAVHACGIVDGVSKLAGLG
jgi:galactokinase